MPQIDQPPDWNQVVQGFEQTLAQGTRPTATALMQICQGLREEKVATQTMLAAIEELQQQVRQIQDVLGHLQAIVTSQQPVHA